MTEIFYNEVGNRVKELDPELKETSYEYNNHDNMIKRTDPSQNETLFEYNHDNYKRASLDETIDLLECVEFLAD